MLSLCGLLDWVATASCKALQHEGAQAALVPALSDEACSCNAGPLALLQAIRVGHEAVAQQCTAIEEWAAAVGRQKRTDFTAASRDLDSQIEVSLVV